MQAASRESIAEPWRVSLHGGHSGDFCLHGVGALRDFLEAAVTSGFSVFGVTAHSPRPSAKYLYAEERDAGYTPAGLRRDFERYAAESASLSHEFEGRLEVLRAAEVEAISEPSLSPGVADLRSRHSLDYVVGSVHWVGELPFDTGRADFKRAVERVGGLEEFAARYYALISELVERIQPEVIGHLDLPRLFADGAPELESPKVRRAVDVVLESARAAGSILDLNVAALRKGLSTPYPAPWIVARARETGVPFCFGDDSHSAAEVGDGLEAGREYLLGLGVETITTLSRASGGIVKKVVPLR